MTPNWKINYWGKKSYDPVWTKQTKETSQRKNKCELCGYVLDYDLDGNVTCNTCGYTEIPCPSCGSYNTKQGSPFTFNRICNTCGATFTD
jgi:hypothetical protein